MEILLRNIPNDYRNKKEYLDRHSNEIEKLFLGSSHTYYGINPTYIEGIAFNAGNRSQTLDLDYRILDSYTNNWNNLQFIIIPVDMFVLYSRLSDEKNNWRLKNYNLYFKFHLTNNLSDYSEVLRMKFMYNIKRIYRYYFLDKIEIATDLGYGINDKTNKDFVKNGIIASKRHTFFNYPYYKESVGILKTIIENAKQNNIYVLLYTSPADSTYVSKLYKDQLGLTVDTAEILAEENSNCTYVNLLNDNSFIRKDFRDSDHVNTIGAKKLSLKLDSIISEISLKNRLKNK